MLYISAIYYISSLHKQTTGKLDKLIFSFVENKCYVFL